MGLINRLYNFVAHTTIDSEQVDAELDQLVATINALDTANIRDAAVTTPKIADSNVTKVKLATDALNAFLKLAVAADRKVAFGRYVEPSGWGGTAEHTGMIAHGLGVSPQSIQLTADTLTTSSGPSTVVSASVTSYDGTNINYKVRSVDGSTAAVGTVINWTAIG